MKVFKLQLVISIIVCITLIPVRAEKPDSGEDQDLDFDGSDCIWVRSIRDYTPLDDRTLLIWGGANRPYYVRLVQSTREMGSAISMGVQSRDDSLCPYGGDALVFGNFDPYPARVRSVSRITTEQAEQLLVRYGKKDADEPQTPAPKEVKGAEVEELD